ncbi:MAG: 2-C-methyl-D-erythritol 4-phosphate cytidylyltransferase [Akkermansiaceae bacterium]
MNCTAIIVAAGSSRRMGFDKLAATMHGKPILAHTLQTFLDCDAITEIVLVAPKDRLELLKGIELTKPFHQVDGGSERHLSVANGLKAVSPSSGLIAVHDAARPLVSQGDILATIAAAQKHGAASLARRVTETLKRCDENNFTQSAVSRENLWFIETPQIFEADLLQSAYQHVLNNGLLVTDETSALEAFEKPVRLIPSSAPNPKITTQADLAELDSTFASPTQN